MQKPLVLFDGICNLCNGTVRFIIRFDEQKIFQFAPLQGKTAQELLRAKNLDQPPQTIILRMPDGKLYYRSAAVIKILSQLGFPFNIAKVFLIVPAFLRDGIYNWVSRNRYKWFGKKETCMVPTPDRLERFLP